MVRHTVSGYFTLLQDLNLDLSFLNSNVEGLEQNMKVLPACSNEYAYVPADSYCDIMMSDIRDVNNGRCLGDRSTVTTRAGVGAFFRINVGVASGGPLQLIIFWLYLHDEVAIY